MKAIRIRWLLLASVLALAAATGLLPGSLGSSTAGVIVPDHFKCYQATGPRRDVPMLLEDQFGSSNPVAIAPKALCNPVDKNGEGIVDPTAHYVCYRIQEPVQHRNVYTQNQFGSHLLVVDNAILMCAPAAKALAGEPGDVPTSIDHLKCYSVRSATTFSPHPVNLADQFLAADNTALRPVVLCNPVQKTVQPSTTPVQFPDRHYVCYQLNREGFARSVFTRDQFGRSKINVLRSDWLCVPSSKQRLDDPTPLPTFQRDHFQCYRAKQTRTLDLHSFTAQDQFVQMSGAPQALYALCNPADKNGDVPEHLDHHLRWYTIGIFSITSAGISGVQIQNQFGFDALRVAPNPEWLVAPSWKSFSGPGPIPSDLEHYLCYRAESLRHQPVGVGIQDQFSAYNTRTLRVFAICNPATKNGSPVFAPNDHLVAYVLDQPRSYSTAGLFVHTVDQFGQDRPKIIVQDVLLVPSVKLDPSD